MDVMSPGHPVRDIWLQTVEALRDTSHVRNYASGEWLRLINEANLIVDNLITDKLPLEFSSWVARMRTPEALVDAIRIYQQSASTEVKTYFALQNDGSFTSDIIMVEAHKSSINKKAPGNRCLSLSGLSGIWHVVVFHKQRQLIAWLQIRSIAVPAHHIFDVHAVAFSNA